jgi:tetratricopeptide (TPR) repeat protein
MERPSSHTLENESRLAFRNLLPPAWIVRDKVPDYGIDMEVDIVEGKKVTNKVLWIQIKSTEGKGHPCETVHYSMKTKHLKHYEGCPLPVLILLWIKSENSFYYLFAQRFIREELSATDPDWRKKKTNTIGFHEDSKLNNVADLSSIATDGYLYIVQQKLNLTPESKSAFYWLNGIAKSDDKELKEGMLKALSFMLKEKYDAAITEFERMLETCTTSPTQRMSVLLNLGNAYSSLIQNDKALENFSAVLELTEKTSERDALEGRSAALGSIGLVYWNKSDFDKALRFHQAALKIHRTLGNKQREAADLGNIGLIYGTKGDWKKALKHHQAALKIHRTLGYKQGEATQLGNIGWAYLGRVDSDNALKNSTKALRLDREIGYKLGEAIQLSNIGSAYQQKGDFGEALKHHQAALKIYRLIGYRLGEAGQLGSMGSIYGMQRDFDKALKFLMEALKIEQEIGHRTGEATQLCNIGNVYGDKRDFGEALKHYQASLKIYKMLGGCKQWEANLLGNIGLVHMEKGDFGKALKLSTQVLNMHREIEDKRGEALDLFHIGMICLAKGDLDKAISSISDAIKIDEFGLGHRDKAIQEIINSLRKYLKS